MTKLYLITGFLGAGKTTFLKNFIRLFAAQRIELIINEFGKAGVDGTLLRELNATLTEINNGSIFCACRLDKFEEVLAEALTHAPDAILVEASGLADPTHLRQLLAQPQFSAVSYQGAICLVDTVRFEKVIDTARVCKKQIAVSSLALLNKVDIASPAQLQLARERITALNPAITLHETTFGALKAEWLTALRPQPVVSDAVLAADITLQKSLVEVSPRMTLPQLRSFLAMLAEDTYRMKGFVLLGETRYLVDCVGGMVEVTPFRDAPPAELGKIVLLSGAGMPLRKGLKTALQWYGEEVQEIK